MPKGIVAAARFSGVVVALASKLEVSPQAIDHSKLMATLWNYEWGRCLLASAAAWFIWEVVDVVAGVKSAKSLSSYRAAAGMTYLQTALMVSLRRLVNQKKNRIYQTLTEATSSTATIGRARSGLQPQQHLYLALESLGLFLRELHPNQMSSEAKQQNFRIGLYVEEQGELHCWAGFDLNNRSAKPFKSYSDRPGLFSLANHANPPLVVRCLRERDLLIMPDCAAEAKLGNARHFAYFDPVQENYLKSMVAFPILDFMRESGTIVRAAVVVDTDVPNHFRKEHRDTIRLFMEEFAARLNFEGHLLALLR